MAAITAHLDTSASALDIFCNNCGKSGHMFYQCKSPIISIGVVAFRIRGGVREYLMIRRRDTLGYIDFMRGKYSIYNKAYVINMLKQMTLEEKAPLLIGDFALLWDGVWNGDDRGGSASHHSEERASRDKYYALLHGVYELGGKSRLRTSAAATDDDTAPATTEEKYTLESMIEESNRGEIWTEAEWGFPKGRRNQNETDYECGIREFCEETGYPRKCLRNVQNVFPFEEIFMGSNYKTYKHKYYLMYVDNSYLTGLGDLTTRFQKSEVSKIEWKTYEECCECIRGYNLEKQRLITNIHKCLEEMG